MGKDEPGAGPRARDCISRSTMSSPTADPVARDPQAPADAISPAAPILAPADPAPPGEPQDAEAPPDQQDAPPDLPASDGPPPGLVPVSKPPISWLAVAALVAGVLPIIPVGLGLGIAGLATTRRAGGAGATSPSSGCSPRSSGPPPARPWAPSPRSPTASTGRSRSSTTTSSPRCSACGRASASTIRAGRRRLSPHVTRRMTPRSSPPSRCRAGPGRERPCCSRRRRRGCSARLASYLNPQLAISLTQDYAYPGQVAWQAGTRTVVCEVRATTGQLDQSVGKASAPPAS